MSLPRLHWQTFQVVLQWDQPRREAVAGTTININLVQIPYFRTLLLQ